MANASLRFLLGLFPKTEDIENKRLALIKEYEELSSFSKSDDLKHFENLSKHIYSPEFAERKHFLKTLSWANSSEMKMEKSYLNSKKSSDVKFFYSFSVSSAYKQYVGMQNSPDIPRFESLKIFVGSDAFKKVEAYMNDKKKWEKTDDYKRLNEYNNLKRNSELKHYFKFVQSSKFSAYKAITDPLKLTKFESKHKIIFIYKKLNNTSIISQFKELETFVKSLEFRKKKSELQSLKFSQTEEYKKWQEYKKLASSKSIKDFYKMKSSPKLVRFQKIESTSLIPDFEKLEREIHSESFQKQKAYLLDKKKWEKSDEIKLLHEFEQLQKSAKIKWYFKLKDSPKYDELKAWNLVFQDEFTGGMLDRKKWLTRYFWGNELLQDTYALPGEKHYFSDAKNIEFNGSTVKLITRKEGASGKEWIPSFGFIPKTFDYTSALLCTGDNFRAKYGRIEAKIKLNSSQGIFHAFWLAGNSKVPQIDIFKFYDDKLLLSYFYPNSEKDEDIKTEQVKLKGSFFTGKYFIYSLDWTPEKLIWRINQLEVMSQIRQVPDESMFITLNSGVLGDQKGSLPTYLEVDWVRCYQHT